MRRSTLDTHHLLILLHFICHDAMCVCGFFPIVNFDYALTDYIGKRQTFL